MGLFSRTSGSSRFHCEVIQGALHAAGSDALRDVSIDFGGGHLGVSEQFLDRAQVFAVFEEVSGEAVPENVGGESFFDSGLCSGPAQGLAVDFWMEVVTADDAGVGVSGNFGSGEKPEPLPFLSSTGHFSCEGTRQGDARLALRPILIEYSSQGGLVISKFIRKRGGEDSDPILVSFSGADGQLAALDIDVLDAQSHQFSKP